MLGFSIFPRMWHERESWDENDNSPGSLARQLRLRRVQKGNDQGLSKRQNRRLDWDNSAEGGNTMQALTTPRRSMRTNGTSL